jgi:GWxTD domain-containing protein
MKKILMIAVILCACNLNISNAKDLIVDMDFTQFKGIEDKTLLDFSYSFADTNLKFVYDSAGIYSGEMYFDIKMTPTIGDMQRSRWIMPVSIMDYNGTFKEVFFGSQAISVDPGEYNVEIFIMDNLDTNTQATLNFTYNVKSFTSTEPQVSDVQLAQLIEKKADTKRQWTDMFYKNGYYVVPKPNSFFTDYTSELIHYTELYNLKQLKDEGAVVVYEVYDHSQNRVLDFKKKLRIVGNSIVDTEPIPLDTLATGAYYFHVFLQSPAENPTFETEHSIQKFYYSNSKKAPEQKSYFIENLPFEKSEYAVMSQESVDDMIEKSLLVAEAADIETYKSIKGKKSDLKTKQRFLFRFWGKRDYDSTTAHNDGLAEFRARLKYCKEFYSYGKTPGWKTDKGYVTLKYGNPSRVNHENRFNDQTPYEVWEYDNLYNGCIFVFVERNDLTNWQLVHSTVPGELYFPEWEDFHIKKSTFEESQEDLYQVPQQQNSPMGF